MGDPEEATIKPNGKISVSNWVRVIVVFFAMLVTMAGDITSYAYVVVIPTMSNKIDNNVQRIANLSVKVQKLDVLEAKLDFIIDDMDEFKSVLRRTVTIP